MDLFKLSYINSGFSEACSFYFLEINISEMLHIILEISLFFYAKRVELFKLKQTVLYNPIIQLLVHIMYTHKRLTS